MANAVRKFEASLLSDVKNCLGESVQWNAQDKRIYWSDIHNRALLSIAIDGSDLKSRRLPDRLGSFSFTNKKDIIIAGFSDGIYRMDINNLSRERLAPYEPIVNGSKIIRLNDGRCDRAGRFLVGGIEETALKDESRLLSMGKHEGLQTLLEGVGCSNGLGFSPDGLKMYHSDSKKSDLMVYDYNQATGLITNGQIFIQIEDGKGVPDGTAIDAEGGVWTSLFNGGEVRRYLPNRTLDMVVTLPVKKVTCACFAGDGLDQLVITTASEGFGGYEHRQEPLAGGLFILDLSQEGIKGLIESRYEI